MKKEKIVTDNLPVEKIIDKKNNDVIEIPIGKYLNRFRENPWILATIVLGIVLVGIIFTSNISVNEVGAQKAGQSLIDFINSQGQGTASLVSAEKENGLYKVVVNFEGDEVPVYTTLDGKFLISTIVPLNNSLNTDDTNSVGNNVQVQADEDDDAVLGDENATLTIIEFSDYGCVFCQSFWSNTLPQIKTEYIETGKAKLVYRDLPLDTECNSGLGRQLHPGACKAAEAAECVREKGGDEKYFKYHDLLFENQKSFTNIELKSWAKQIGYNIESCLDSGKYSAEVIADIADAQAAGGQGTPYFVILTKDGRTTTISGAESFSNFKRILDALLVEG